MSTVVVVVVGAAVLVVMVSARCVEVFPVGAPVVVAPRTSEDATPEEVVALAL